MQSRRGKNRKRRLLHIVVTAGPTREHFDPVRFISNASSGKMGYAIAEAAARAGHQVTLISGPVAIRPPAGVKTIQVISAAEMATATRRAFRSADAAVFSAAVSDFRPRRALRRKAPKSAVSRRMELEPTEDIAASLGKIKKSRITIGFALEDHAGRIHAERKLREKRLDAIVLNGPGNIGAEHARAEFLSRAGEWKQWKRLSKKSMARRIVRELEGLNG